MSIKLVLILLALCATKALSQPTLDTLSHTEYCKDGTKVGFIGNTDTVRLRVVLDSINKLLIGQWQLISVGMKAFDAMPLPEDSIKMNIDGQGHSIIYRKGVPIAKFQFAAGMNYNFLRSVISEVGRVYFHLKIPLVVDGQVGMKKGELIYRNGLRVCENYLTFYAFTSAGPSYLFRRLTPTYH